MSEQEEKIESRLRLVVGLVWAMAVGGFGVGTWATTVELRLRASDDTALAVKRVEYYVTKIANKVGVEIEPPR